MRREGTMRGAWTGEAEGLKPKGRCTGITRLSEARLRDMFGALLHTLLHVLLLANGGGKAQKVPRGRCRTTTIRGLHFKHSYS